MSHFNFYPHFVADQVLTANHLNELFNYLDDQERLTRNHLIGIGIVCGLELSCSNTQIIISKGCGVTSDGFLIIQDAAATYTHYRNYTISNDLKTTTPYNQFIPPASLQLLTGVTDAGTDKPLAGASINRQDYAVVLLLEKKTIDLKNCTTNDCDDKGEKVELNLKPLLVLKSKLSSFAYFGYETKKMNLPEVPLKRFNVPFQQLITPSDILSSFLTIADNTTLQAIQVAYSGAYDAFKIILPDNSNPFQNLHNVISAKINNIKNNNPVYIQYCYDFIDDLIKAYAEFHEKGMDVITECCPDEAAFRYHLMLGDSNQSTAAGNSSYRQGFIYSPIFNGQKDKAKEVQMMFKRMKLLVSDFAGTDLKKFMAKGIRITPSRWGREVLSERAIPYHYEPNNLYNVWNYTLTKRGKSTRNLSYHSDTYNAPADIKNALKYDIEPYNFFRIEGHIGTKYELAFPELIKQKKQHNLPIDIIALNMRTDEGNITADDLTCFFQDLDSQYNVLISELLCKVHHPVCFISSLPYTVVKKPGGTTSLFNDKAGAAEKAEEKSLFMRMNEAKAKKKESGEIKKTEETDTAAVGLSDMLSMVKDKQESGTLNAERVVRKKIEVNLFAADEPIGYIAEVRAKGVYTRGDFLKKHCSPPSGTIGFEYLDRVKKGKVFSNPGNLPSSGDPDIVLKYFQDLYFYFVDCADKMFAALLPFDLGELDMDKFQDRYDVFQKACWQTGNTILLFIAVLDAQATKDDETPNQITDDIFDAWISLVASEIQIMAHLCIDERLQTLKEEYAKRIERLIKHRIFSQYSKDHTGIEHKAGVPKGGTFIIVYARGKVKQAAANNETMVEMAAESMAAEKMSLTENKEVAGKLTEDKGEKRIMGKNGDQLTSEKQRKMVALKEQIVKIKGEEAGSLTADEMEVLAGIEKALGAEAFLGEAFDIADGIVFADFYLPYMCCSDCAPISYVVEETKPDPVQPTISIVPAEFCNNDTGEYAITTTPGGGTLVKAPGVDDVNFKFKPLGLPEGDAIVTYTKDGLNATQSCKIFAPKPADFTLQSSVDALGVFTVTIVPADNGGSHEWFLDDATSPFSIKPTPDPLTFTLTAATLLVTITHKVKNGPCTSEPISKEILLQKTTSNVTDPPISACFSQNIALTALSAGMQLTVSDAGGLQINEQGFIVFSLPLPTPQLITTVKYTITTASTITNHTVSVTLFRNFSAAFTTSQKEQPDGVVELTCTATDAAAPGHKWSVDGAVALGETAAVFKPVFTFSTQEKVVKVRHFVDNGQCHAEVEIPVTLKHNIINDNIKAYICNIESDQIIDASLSAGDTINVLSADGSKIKISQSGKTVVASINTKAFPATSIIKVVYKITKANSQVINRTADIQVGVVDTKFRITYMAAANVFELEALGGKVASAHWELLDQVNNVVTFKADGNPVKMLHRFTDINKGLITLKLALQLGPTKDDVCEGTTTLNVNSKLFGQIMQTPGGMVFP